MKGTRGAALWIGVVAALAALLFAVLLPGTLSETEQALRQADALGGDVKALTDQISVLQARAEALRKGTDDANTRFAGLSQDLAKMQIAEGATALDGPGVEITLSDASREHIRQSGPDYDINWFLVHDHDVLRVINVLKSAGAEAMAVNGVRLLPDTAIHCGGPAIYVRDIALTPPFIISAIGDPAQMRAAVLGGGNRPPSDIYLELTSFGIEFTVNTPGQVSIPSADSTDAAVRAAHQ